MSEDKNKWKEEIRAILKEELKAIQPPPSSEAKPSEKHEEKTERPHATVDELDNCPTCRVTYKIDDFKAKEKAKVLKEIIDKAHGRFHCKKCGLKDEGKKGEPCPLCGETHAE